MNFTKDFEQILVEFFKRYDEKNLKTIPEIMRRFKRDEKDVIIHLCARYNVDITTIDGVEANMSEVLQKKSVPVAESSVSDNLNKDTESDESTTEDHEEAPKKSKKKLIVIVLLVVILAGAGVGYMFMSGGLGSAPETEETEQVESTEEEAATTEEAAAEEAAAAKAAEEAAAAKAAEEAAAAKAAEDVENAELIQKIL